MTKKVSKKKPAPQPKTSTALTWAKRLGITSILGVGAIAITPALMPGSGSTWVNYSAGPNRMFSYDVARVVPPPRSPGVGIIVRNSSDVSFDRVQVSGFENGIVEDNVARVSHRDVKID